MLGIGQKFPTFSMQACVSLEKGKDADLIIVKLIDGLPMVTQTIVKGKIAVQTPQEITYNELSYA